MKDTKNYVNVTMRFLPERVEFIGPDGTVLAISDAKSQVTDLRKHPPFLTMSPCPYCAALEDRNHIPILHVNPKLGTPV